MSFANNITKIANGFTRARTEPLKNHPLADLIRNGWPKSLITLLPIEITASYKFDSSPGQGEWSHAPWLAILHPQITKSAMYGFYPVYLFEPGFKTVCLVMGQGAQSLCKSLGDRAALIELKRRAELLRELGGKWSANGFYADEFLTMKAASVSDATKAKTDSWSASVAYGKRYFIDQLPSDDVLVNDLKKMLKLYDHMASNKSLKFSKIDAGLAELKASDELPKSRDGAIKTYEHVRLERRERNRKLIKAAKEKLGYVCQACNFSFAKKYGNHMSEFIEAHHILPLSKLPASGKDLSPTEDDFMMLCSNCHRAIHRAGCPDLNTFKNSFKR